MMFAHVAVRLSWACGSDESRRIRFGLYDTGYYAAQFQKDPRRFEVLPDPLHPHGDALRQRPKALRR
jgi:hypothetical protein